MDAVQRPLTPLQARFVEEYLADLNATAAYRRAGYKAKTDNAAAASASALLRNPKIANAVRAAKGERSKRAEITADRVLEELGRLAFSDLDHYAIDDKGQVALAKDAPTGAMRAVSSIKRKVRHLGEGRIEYDTEIRLWDKPGTLRTVAQHLGMLVEKHEVTGKGGAPIEAKVTHGIDDDLAPYAAAVTRFLAASLAGGGPDAIPAEVPAKPVGGPEALPQAGAIPPA